MGANDTAGTFTGRACLSAFAVGTSGALTVFAGNEFLDFDFLLDAGVDFLEGKAHFDAKIGTATDALSAAAVASKELREMSAELAAHAPRLEQIAELLEDILHRESLSAAETACALHAGKTELVVALPFLRVAEHLIRLSRLLELLLGFFVTRVFVRVVLYRFLAVRLFYLLCGSRFRDSEDLVIISFFCHSDIDNLTIDNLTIYLSIVSFLGLLCVSIVCLTVVIERTIILDNSTHSSYKF